MSGSLSRCEKASVKHDTYTNFPSRANSYKEFNNQSHSEQKQLDHHFGNPLRKDYETFSRDLHLRNQRISDVITDINNYRASVKKSANESIVSTPQHIKKMTPRTFSRESSTSPKIVGVERKKVLNYKPIYMQRHSMAYGDDFTNKVDNNYQYPQSSIRRERSTEIPNTSFEVSKSNEAEHPVTSPLSSIKDRISFFNRLSSQKSSENSVTKPKNTFLSLLRREKQQEPKAYRLSQLLTKVIIAKNAFSPNSATEETIKGPASPDLYSPKSFTHAFKFNSHSLPNPIKRKPSFEKTKPVASSIGRSSFNNGTNPKRHNLMQDLSLVVPVRFRVAEFEKRNSIQM